MDERRGVSPREAFKAPRGIRASGDWLTFPTPALTDEERCLWSAMNSHRRRLSPGGHMALGRVDADGEVEVFMNDAEWYEHRRVLALARCRVVVTGLGLVCFVRAMIARGRVNHITIVEREPDVIDLVWPDLARWAGDRGVSLYLHVADAVTGPLPPGRWDLAWHDIWPTISVGNITEMITLRRRYNRRTRRQICWAEGLAWRDMRDGVRGLLLRALRARAIDGCGAALACRT